MLPKLLRFAAIGGFATALSACGMIYKTTGDVLVRYGQDEMVPYLMHSDDVDMSCAMGESLTPLLLSFEAVGSKPDKLGALVYTTAALCSENLALEEELRYQRALRRGDVDEAKDARTQQKRYAEIAARRQLESYNRTIKVFGEATEDSCPKLKNDFDELVWMVGSISGMQALLNDSTANNRVGVPRDVPAKVQRGAACLDNYKWWGVPNGTRAVIWNILPMLAPEGADGWAELEKSVRLGFQHGVRLPSALYAMTAYSLDDPERMRKGIREFVANDKNINEEYALLDALATHIIQSISDRLWTDRTGQRTPYGELGTFWDDQTQEEDINIDDLLF